MRKRAQPEQQIQKAVVAHLKARGVPGLFWFHPPNGGARTAIEAAIFKGLGVKAGVPDLVLLHEGRFYGLELKREDGNPTVAQVACMEAINASGGFACIAHGLDRALAVLEQWKLLRGSAQ